jgi:hypothetical protein
LDRVLAKSVEAVPGFDKLKNVLFLYIKNGKKEVFFFKKNYCECQKIQFQDIKIQREKKSKTRKQKNAEFSPKKPFFHPKKPKKSPQNAQNSQKKCQKSQKKAIKKP